MNYSGLTCPKILDRRSICTTCLAYNRKMYPVTYNNPYSSLIEDLKLSINDRVCWECHSFILKMSAFRHKALRARNCLDNLVKGKPTTLQCLSTLSKSKGVYYEIKENVQPAPTYTFTQNLPAANMAVIFNSNPDEISNFQVFSHKTITCDKISKDKCINCKVLQKSENDKISEANQGSDIDIKSEVNHEESNSLANTTLLSLLNRKRPLPTLPTTSEFKIPKSIRDDEPVLDDDLEKESEVGSQKTKFESAEPVEVANQFTEERLSEEEFIKWWQKKKELKSYERVAMFWCEKCSEPFWTRATYSIHKKIHMEMYGELSCNYCEVMFYSEEMLAAHKDRHCRLLKCGHCGHKWDNPNTMRDHLENVHRVPMTVWTCDLCSRELPTLRKMVTHMNRHCLLKCPDCDKKLGKLSLKAHMLIHKSGPDKPYTCDHCAKGFNNKDRLRYHIQRHVVEKNNSFCAECGIRFINTFLYKEHLKNSIKHMSQENLRHSCEVCGAAFQLRHQLNNHASMHTDQRNYKCEVCPATFKNKNHVRRHHRYKHEGRERVLKRKDKICDHCGKAFSTKRQLIDHINSHTGARPYACKLCGATFGHSSALYLHGRWKHKIQKKNKR